MSRAACPFEDDVLVLADGDLAFERRIVVEAHLGVCAACAALEETLTLAEEALAAADVPPLGAAERALDALPLRASSAPALLGRAAAVLLVGALSVALVRRTVHVEPPSAPGVEIGSRREETPPDSHVPARGPATSDGVAALPQLPEIPPPTPRAGPALRRRLAALAPGSSDYATAVDEIARGLTARGRAGSSALAEVLRGDDPALRARALDVATQVAAPEVTAALDALVGDADVGARALDVLAARGGPRVVSSLVRGLGAGPQARDALVAVGGAEAAAALTERWYAADDAERPALLDAVVRADAATGAQLLVEIAAQDPRSVAARAVARERSAEIARFLRHAADGRDTLRARAAARVLGWAGDTRAVPLLARLARSPRTAPAATSALLDIGDGPALRAALDAVLVAGTDGAVAAAFERCTAAEPFLLERALRGESAEQGVALRLLARCGTAETARAFAATTWPRALLVDVVATLGAVGGADGAAALGPLAEVPGLAPDVVTALGATHHAAAVAWLERIAAADERRVPRVAAALAEIEDAASARALVRLLEVPRAIDEVVDALARLPAGLVVPALLAPEDERVSANVRRALTRFAGRDLGPRALAWRSWWEAQP